LYATDIQGADTTSTALAGCFFYLSAYPSCYKRLVSEIRGTFASGSEIQSGQKMSQCVYLRACIDEAMRMSPPITGILWREVCTGGIVLDNEFIPEGYDVGVSLYAIHHNEALFPDSYTFKPERWIPGECGSLEALARARHAFNPFSLGARACAGRTMAYMELSDTLARTIWHLDFRRAEGFLGSIGAGVEGARDGRDKVMEFQMQEYLTVHHEGPFLQFRAREDVVHELFEK
jgi:cytochrome P450